MKHEEVVAIYIKALSFRDNPTEMAKFIKKYKKYFPKITEEDLNHLENN